MGSWGGTRRRFFSLFIFTYLFLNLYCLVFQSFELTWTFPAVFYFLSSVSLRRQGFLGSIIIAAQKRRGVLQDPRCFLSVFFSAAAGRWPCPPWALSVRSETGNKTPEEAVLLTGAKVCVVFIVFLALFPLSPVPPLCTFTCILCSAGMSHGLMKYLELP